MVQEWSNKVSSASGGGPTVELTGALHEASTASAARESYRFAAIFATFTSVASSDLFDGVQHLCTMLWLYALNPWTPPSWRVVRIGPVLNLLEDAAILDG